MSSNKVGEKKAEKNEDYLQTEFEYDQGCTHKVGGRGRNITPPGKMCLIKME